MIRLLIADDEALVRMGLRVVLSAEPDFAVVAEVADGTEVLAAVREHKPDVVLMDLRMPVLDGIGATKQLIHQLDQPPKVIVVTTFESDANVLEALRVGAAGFIVKRSLSQEIADAIRIVARGDTLVFPPTLQRLIVSTSRAQSDELRGAGLTDREAEVLRLVARGFSNAEIANHLFVGIETVKTHVANVLMKTGARDRTQAVIAAYESSFVKPS
jgi:DNA-binding NarL/FixJ family response regulator